MDFRHSTRRLGIFSAVATMAVAGLVLTACSGTTPADTTAVDAGEWDSVVEAANAEGSLTVYTTQPGSDVFIKEEFEEAYPDITVTVNRLATGDMLPLLDQEIEGAVRSADVTFHAEHPWFAERGEQGALAPISVNADNESAYGDFEGEFGIPILRYGYSFGHNTNLGEPVASIEELVESAEASGVSIGLNDSGSSTAMKSQYALWEATYPGILERIGALPHVAFSGTQPIAQSMGAGEVGFGVGFVPGVIPPLAAQGAPIAEDIPTSAGVGGVELSAGILATAPHPNAAVVFTNWLMTPGVQKQLTELWPGMVGFVVPGLTGLKYDDIQIYDHEEWTDERRKDFQADWDALFKG
ncbi:MULTISPECIES: extracellular solute-binding protein [unclassified Microbacterium]|uniref:ABC transporter substrate-binding protein n=1 Tax=unclassified Microbacterium TaxID=2609290 RepID=UPI00214C7CA8|nr:MULTISPECIES: extracellular solute-binding protein [unclassified Microbacterium]MCR2811389.1 extracellular solute-binding protein [Microbacterium sp. zg.B185]WIM19565.1 extracellular solute-binding protein [Microbacterium sp. zg-B185]